MSKCKIEISDARLFSEFSTLIFLESGNVTQAKWTYCIIDKIFENIEIVKFITTALNSVLKLVKLQSLVAKCCKRQKIQACKICKFY